MRPAKESYKYMCIMCVMELIFLNLFLDIEETVIKRYRNFNILYYF